MSYNEEDVNSISQITALADSIIGLISLRRATLLDRGDTPGLTEYLDYERIVMQLALETKRGTQRRGSEHEDRAAQPAPTTVLEGQPGG